MLAGFATDALLVPALVEAQNRTGQFTWGARVAARFAVGHAALAVHEQRDLTGVAYRVVSADAQVQAGSAVSLGGRLTFDTTALAVSEARLFVDLATPVVPLSVDYSYQSPALLLPRTSILAAFGGASWHELGAEATLVAMQSLKLSARAAGQLFEQDRLGGRASLKATWVPDIDRRGLVLAEAGRVYAPPSGFTFARVGARWRATPVVWLSGDGSVYRYDQPIRGVSSSVTGVGSVEWAPLARMRVVLSGTVMTTPYSTFEAQGLAKLVIELGTNTEGSTP